MRTVNCVSNRSARALNEHLTRNGFRILPFSGHRVHDSRSFFEAAREQLPLDPPLGNRPSWDGFADSFVGALPSLGAVRVAVIWTHSDLMLEHGLPDLLIASSVFESLAAWCDKAKEKPTQLTLFFQGEGPNFRDFEVR